MTRAIRLVPIRLAQALGLMLSLMLVMGSNSIVPTASAGTERAESDAALVNHYSIRAALAASVQLPPSTVGQWSPAITSLPIVAIHAHLLPNGKVLIFQDDDNPNYPVNGSRLAGSTKAYVWDVATGGLTQINHTLVNVFCSGHAFLPDGRLLVAGGHAGQDGVGIRDTYTFNSINNQYSWVNTNALMTQGRWYPSVISLANGEVLVMAGSINGSLGNNKTPEVWKTNTGGGWRGLTSAVLDVPIYPYLHVAPNGRVFMSGPSTTTRYLNTSGTGVWSTVATRVGGNRNYGESVMYDNGKVLIIGGGSPPTNTAEVIDLNAATPAWRAVGSMAFARQQMNATLLPDGKVLVTGGTNSTTISDVTNAALAAEMWNPVTETWTTMASMQQARVYHSTALLLPDGRVLMAGSGRPGVERRTAEIYSPPYLFKGARPTITSAPTSVGYNQTFSINTPNALGITNVTLIRLSSVTHSRNMNQRINRLSFTRSVGRLNVTTPANGNLCPPGHYMLFILNSSGVPSLAKIIAIT